VNVAQTAEKKKPLATRNGESRHEEFHETDVMHDQINTHNGLINDHNSLKNQTMLDS
jgi:hypothetical protein